MPRRAAEDRPSLPGGPFHPRRQSRRLRPRIAEALVGAVLRCRYRARPLTQPPRILGLSNGDPFSPLTFSGITRRLFAALRERDALAGAVDARHLHRASLALSFHPDRRRWRQLYDSGSFPLAGAVRSRRGAVALRRSRALLPASDTVLQIGAFIDLGDATRPRLACSYNDGNVLAYLARRDTLLDPSTPSIRRAVDRERRLYERLDLIMPMSTWLRDSFVNDFGLDPAKVVAVGGGANFDELPEPPAAREWDRPRILFVGKGSWERKGGPELLRAFAAVREAVPGAELWVVGQDLADPPEGVTSFGLISRATAEGERQVRGLYERATAFALPSHFEPYGFALLEASAMGLPCIATSGAGGAVEHVDDTVTGFVVPAGDDDALADRLVRLATDPALAARLGAGARAHVVEHATWPATAGRMVAAIEARRAAG